MSELKHTKGNWEVSGFKQKDISFTILSKRGVIVSVHSLLSLESGEAEANARLIAKAPEMLELLEHCKAVIDCGDKHDERNALSQLDELLTSIKGE